MRLAETIYDYRRSVGDYVLGRNVSRNRLEAMGVSYAFDSVDDTGAVVDGIEGRRHRLTL